MRDARSTANALHRGPRLERGTRGKWRTHLKHSTELCQSRLNSRPSCRGSTKADAPFISAFNPGLLGITTVDRRESRWPAEDLSPARQQIRSGQSTAYGIHFTKGANARFRALLMREARRTGPGGKDSSRRNGARPVSFWKSSGINSAGGYR